MLLLNVPLATTLVSQGQAKIPTIVSPAHVTVLQGAPAQPTATPPTATTKQAIDVTATAMRPPALDTPTTTRHLPPHNTPTRAWTSEMMMRIKQIKLKLLNAKIEQEKIKFKIREQ